MNLRSRGRLVLWLACVLLATVVVLRARYITDLSAFLPAHPTPTQKLLVDQLRDGPASRLLLVGIDGGTAAQRAAVSRAMALRLRALPEFASVDNGESVDAEHAERDQTFLFDNRYLLSETVSAARFSADGLRHAIEDTVDGLASSAGLMLKSLVPRDPTGEMLGIIERLSSVPAPRSRDGVWVSADGTRALLVVQTAAAGSDTDAQEQALRLIDAAYAATASPPDTASPPATATSSPTTATASPTTAAIRVRASGPGVFAVAARAKIKGAATRLSLISSALVIVVLLSVYRSPVALLLGLLPVATGALVGIAAVALGFGAVHGITLGFGITLIGESVDYSIYFFIQSRRHATRDSSDWQRALWPTIRLGVLTSVVGFASLLPSGFPGLAQLGLYSISGLAAAALVTRFVLPELLPADFRVRDLTVFGSVLERGVHSLRARRSLTAASAVLIASMSAAVLYLHRDTLWDRDLAALSPISSADQRYDALLREDVGAANVLDFVVVSGADLEAVLRGAERAAPVLDALTAARVIDGYDSPVRYLPSIETQATRRAALPEAGALRAALHTALIGSDLDETTLAPFLRDVAAARVAPAITPQALRGTSLVTGFDALILHQAARWNAILPLHAVGSSAGADIDVAHVRAALAEAHLPDTFVLDIKAQSDLLYSDYLREAMKLSLAGLLAIVVLLLVALRSPLRTLAVMMPLVLAVLVVAAMLVFSGQQLNILHLVGMLLIVAVGSNYAFFFDERRAAHAPLTLASLVIANVSTVLVFGLLSFSRVPVLVSLGTTVAPGALLARVLAALLAPGTPREPGHA